MQSSDASPSVMANCMCQACRTDQEHDSWLKLWTEWCDPDRSGSSGLCRTIEYRHIVKMLVPEILSPVWKTTEAARTIPLKGPVRKLFDACEKDKYARDRPDLSVIIAVSSVKKTKATGEEFKVGMHIVGLMRIVRIVPTVDWETAYPPNSDAQKVLDPVARDAGVYQLVLGEGRDDRIILRTPVFYPPDSVPTYSRQGGSIVRVPLQLARQVFKAGRQPEDDRTLTPETERVSQSGVRRSARQKRCVGGNTFAQDDDDRHDDDGDGDDDDDDDEDEDS